jgi:hypothetical protein
MNTTKKSLATATVAATALAGFGFVLAPSANASATATKAFTKTFQQTCQQVGILTNQKLSATVSGVTPTTVKKGAAFSLTGAKIKVVVPAGINTVLSGSGISSATVTFSVINLNNVNLSPTTVDAVKTNITTAKIPVVAGKTSTFAVPKTGTLSVALKGGTKAGAATIKAGSITATFQGYNSSGAKVGGAQPVSCSASNTVLTSLTVN